MAQPINLDDVAAVRRIDSQDMLELTAGYGDQFVQGLELVAEQYRPPATRPPIERVILICTGGAADSGHLLRSLLFDTLRVPLIVNQAYQAPGFVDDKTLALVVSHSGNTEQSLSAYQQAAERGAHIVAVTAGGKLLEAVQQRKDAVILIPGGLMPRAALGYALVPILVVLHRLGLIPNPEPAIRATVATLARLAKAYRPETPLGQNPAKQLAVQLAGKVPLIYGSLPYYEGVARRFSNQFAQNSKLMAFCSTVPALHNDEIAGWDGPPEINKRFGVIFLNDPHDDPEIAERMRLTRELLAVRAGMAAEATAEGETLMERMFSLVMLGDFVSLYMPIARGVDPAPVAMTDRSKQRVDS